MKRRITNEVSQFVSDYQCRFDRMLWREPIAGFASVSDSMFKDLNRIVSETHLHPEDMLPDAKTVIVYFIPFTEWIVESNCGGRSASHEWALAYVEINRMISELGQYLKGFLENSGYSAASISPVNTFKSDKLISDWSHRHVAYIAGLGKFGLNNMLITRMGCCGRFGSLVTSAGIEPDLRCENEFCLYKLNGSCMKCLKSCQSKSLQISMFDRFKCYESCLYNAREYKSIGEASVCGKCLVGIPCSMKIPYNQRADAKQE